VLVCDGVYAGKRELMPEALDMCDNFTALKELQLFSPLEDSPLEDLQVGTPARHACCSCAKALDARFTRRIHGACITLLQTLVGLVALVAAPVALSGLPGFD